MPINASEELFTDWQGQRTASGDRDPKLPVGSLDCCCSRGRSRYLCVPRSARYRPAPLPLEEGRRAKSLAKQITYSSLRERDVCAHIFYSSRALF
eukprot:6191678-Pleurochrysis_carterae.AAC.1